MVRTEGALQGGQGLRRTETLDRLHLGAVGLHGEHQAGARGPPLDDDRAGATDAVLTADMRSCQANLLAEEVGEIGAHIDVGLDGPAVDAEVDLARVHAGPPALRRASASARRVTTPAK